MKDPDELRAKDMAAKAHTERVTDEITDAVMACRPVPAMVAKTEGFVPFDEVVDDVIRSDKVIAQLIAALEAGPGDAYFALHKLREAIAAQHAAFYAEEIGWHRLERRAAL